jgi:hypothetical protein
MSQNLMSSLSIFASLPFHAVSLVCLPHCLVGSAPIDEHLRHALSSQVPHRNCQVASCST